MKREILAFFYFISSCSSGYKTGDVSSNSLSAENERGASRPASGSVVWANDGKLEIDDYGHAYLAEASSQNTFKRIDKSSGRLLWSRDLKSYDPFLKECANKDTLVMNDSGEILGIDVETGDIRWNTTLGGVLNGKGGNLHCSSSGDLAYVTYGEHSEFLTAVDKNTGKKVFDHAATGNFSRYYFSNLDEINRETLLMTLYLEDGIRLSAINSTTGKEKWSINGASGMSVVSSGDRIDNQVLIVRENSGLKAISIANGSVLWTFKGDQYKFWQVSLDYDQLSIYGSDFYTRVDKFTGQAVWSYKNTSMPDAFLTAKTLPNGDALISLSSYQTNQSSFVYINGMKGTVAWTHSEPGTSLWPANDNQNRVYVFNGNDLSLLDSRSGKKIWTYRFMPSNPYERLSGDILEGDASSVYVKSQGEGNVKNPPQSLISIDLATGMQRFIVSQEGTFDLSGSDENQLFVSIGLKAVSIAK
ncbi:MAG: PQQ-binding-like beta-propeller repeat protein [Oligoflexales bacterium]|nr:PQQ-binding-like beta-propeller repeat protein [Oligoflexales bacterium]